MLLSLRLRAALCSVWSYVSELLWHFTSGKYYSLLPFRIRYTLVVFRVLVINITLVIKCATEVFSLWSPTLRALSRDSMLQVWRCDFGMRSLCISWSVLYFVKPTKKSGMTYLTLLSLCFVTNIRKNVSPLTLETLFNRLCNNFLKFSPWF